MKKKKVYLIIMLFILIISACLILVYIKHKDSDTNSEYSFRKVVSFKTDSEKALFYTINERDNKYYIESRYSFAFETTKKLRIFDNSFKNITPNNEIDVSDFYIRSGYEGFGGYISDNKIVDLKGNIHSYDAEYIYDYTDQLIIAEKEQKYCLLDNEGNEILKCEYDSITTLGNSYILAIKNGEGKIIRDGVETSLSVKIDPEYIDEEYMSYYVYNYLIDQKIFLNIKSDGKQGIITADNEIICEFIYNDIDYMESQDVFYGIRKSNNATYLDILNLKGKVLLSQKVSSDLVNIHYNALVFKDSKNYYAVNKDFKFNKINKPDSAVSCDIEGCYDNYLVGKNLYLFEGIMYDFDNNFKGSFSHDLVTIIEGYEESDLFVFCSETQNKNKYNCMGLNDQNQNLVNFTFDATEIEDIEYIDAYLYEYASSIYSDLDSAFYKNGCMLDNIEYNINENLAFILDDGTNKLYHSSCKLIEKNFSDIDYTDNYVILKDKHDRVLKILDSNGNKLKIKNEKLLKKLEYIYDSNKFFKGPDGIYMLEKTN